jgi:hypothetical protein
MRLFTMASMFMGLLAVGGEAGAQNAQNTLHSYSNRYTAAGFTGDKFRNSIMNRAVPRYSNPGSTSSAQTRRDKPFSSIVRKPTVSPYLGLLSNNPFTSTTDNYFNIVRPQIEQQKVNQQLAARNAALQRQLNDVAAQGPYSPTGAQDRAPTGHTAVYMNYGGYYTPSRPNGVRGGK